MLAIHKAALQGKVARVSSLVSKDSKMLNTKVRRACVSEEGWDVSHCTPLMAATMAGRAAVVERLLALGARVNLQDALGWSAAFWACMHDREAILKQLLDKRASVTLRDSRGNGIVFEAVTAGAVNCLKLLLAHADIDVNAATPRGATPLMKAAAMRRVDIVKMLLEAGADPSLQDMGGWTAADHALVDPEVDADPCDHTGVPCQRCNAHATVGYYTQQWDGQTAMAQHAAKEECLHLLNGHATAPYAQQGVSGKQEDAADDDDGFPQAALLV